MLNSNRQSTEYKREKLDDTGSDKALLSKATYTGGQGGVGPLLEVVPFMQEE